MIACFQCGGAGCEEFMEDDRCFYDTCLHCGGRGKISKEEHFLDQANQVAVRLAYQKVSDQRKAANEDPEGEGWDSLAYANGAEPYWYFRDSVDILAEQLLNQLLEQPQEELDLLIAWNEYDDNPENWKREVRDTGPISHPIAEIWHEDIYQGDDLPF
jgi:hypothetical protein